MKMQMADNEPEVADKQLHKSSPEEKKMDLSYSKDLVDHFDAVVGKARNGVQTCFVMSAFTAEFASLMEVYSRNMLKIANHCTSEEWAVSLKQSWDKIQGSLVLISEEYGLLSSLVSKNISCGMKAFASQQESQIHRLVSEGYKIQATFHQCESEYAKTKKKYEKKCTDAVEAIRTWKRAVNDSPSVSSSEDKSFFSQPNSNSSSNSASQLLSKVWDSTASFAKPSCERLRTKVENNLDDVIAIEDQYICSVSNLNKQRTIYEQQIKDNLINFQLTEEQRTQYLKEMFIRISKIRSASLLKIRSYCKTIQEFATSIEPTTDVESNFTIMELLNEEDEGIYTDSYEKKILQHVRQIQSLAETSQKLPKMLLNGLVELIQCQESYVAGLEKLSRFHESNASSDIFASTTHVVDEGETLIRAWNDLLGQIDSISNAHREFASLLAEPVSLNIDTMLQEYDETRRSLAMNFSKCYSDIHTDYDTLFKINQRRENGFEDKQKLSDTNEHQIDTIRKSIKKKYANYKKQVIKTISLHQKNELFRLQVCGSSFEAFGRAIMHLTITLQSSLEGVTPSFEQIDISYDISEFIGSLTTCEAIPDKLQPQVKKVHLCDALKTNLEERKKQKLIKKVPPPLNLSASMDNKVEEDKRLAALISEHNGGKTDLICSPQSTKHDPLYEDDSSSSSEVDDDSFFSPRNQASSFSSKIETNSSFSSTATMDFQKKFKLPQTEQLVVSFSCAILQNNFPFHGRLYLSQNYMCFDGWIDSYSMIQFEDVCSIDKKNTALVVPNAIEVCTRDNKYFFTSFLYREDCFQTVCQLWEIKKQMSEIMKVSTPCSSSMESNKEDIVDIVEAPSPTENDEVLLKDFEIVLDQSLPFSLSTIYQKMWNDAEFFDDFLVEMGETNISISKWSSSESFSYTAISMADSFDQHRSVSFTHNKKYIVGPSTIPTSQVHRLNYKDNEKLTISQTSTVSDVPYCDYFRAESRWVFLSNQKATCCRVAVGVKVHFLKSTWLKKQIESSTISEAKEGLKKWVDFALASLSKNCAPVHPSSLSTSSTPVRKEESVHGTEAEKSSSGERLFRNLTTVNAVRIFETVVLVLQSLCVLFFFYILYQICGSLAELHKISTATLLQQEKQNQRFEEILRKLNNIH